VLTNKLELVPSILSRGRPGRRSAREKESLSTKLYYDFEMFSEYTHQPKVAKFDLITKVAPCTHLMYTWYSMHAGKGTFTFGYYGIISSAGHASRGDYSFLTHSRMLVAIDTSITFLQMACACEGIQDPWLCGYFVSLDI
jgi:hypothetical protein